MNDSGSLTRKKWDLGFCLDLYVFHFQTSEEALLLGIICVVLSSSIPCAEI